MRILVLNPFELSAATTIRMEQLSRVLAKRHEMLFVSYSGKAGRFRKEGIEYIISRKELPSPFFHFCQMWVKLVVCMREDYDAIYASKPLPWALFPAKVACALRKKKLILDWDEHEYAIVSRISRNRLYTGLIGLIEKQGVKSADMLVVVSPYLERLAIEWGCKKEHIIMVQNGVDPSEFRRSKTEKKDALKKRFGIDKEDRIVMFVGSLRPQFDIDILIRAMAYVAKKVKGARLVIAGGGAEREKLEKLAESVGIKEKTLFLGPQPHESIPSLIKMAEVVVAPNRKNKMNLSRSPVKIAEYMMMGTPIVANAVGLAEDMLKDGAGELVYSENPDDMARGIVKLLSDKKRGENFAEKARERAEKSYSWELLGKKLERFVEKNSGQKQEK